MASFHRKISWRQGANGVRALIGSTVQHTFFTLGREGAFSRFIASTVSIALVVEWFAVVESARLVLVALFIKAIEAIAIHAPLPSLVNAVLGQGAAVRLKGAMEQQVILVNRGALPAICVNAATVRLSIVLMHSASM
jgi:hypothetical protein